MKEKIEEVYPIDNYVLKLVLTNNRQIFLDIKPYLDSNENLGLDKNFKKVYLEDNIIKWKHSNLQFGLSDIKELKIKVLNIKKIASSLIEILFNTNEIKYFDISGYKDVTISNNKLLIDKKR